MAGLWELIQRLLGSVTLWVIVAPWEQALLVRAGRRRRLLGPGLHPKLPVLDVVYKQSIRMRSAALAVQTLTTRDGKTMALGAVLAYAIGDLERLYDTLHHAEDTVRNLCLGAITEYVAEHDAIECRPCSIAAAAVQAIRLERYGLSSAEVQIADFAFLRAYRLIGDNKWGGFGEALNTAAIAK